MVKAIKVADWFGQGSRDVQAGLTPSGASPLPQEIAFHNEGSATKVREAAIKEGMHFKWKATWVSQAGCKSQEQCISNGGPPGQARQAADDRNNAFQMMDPLGKPGRLHITGTMHFK
ncbi:hypothetical protein ACTZGP_12695 [Pseudomonas putida]|uniref:hypothetical protein n=1 Tax=Pseudomonas putida TaxID=303 RepID=UPI003FD1FF73